mgnify:CR=1 FL=1
MVHIDLKKKISNKGPKPCKATLITSSPYTNILKIKQEQKQKEIEKEDLKKQKRDRKNTNIPLKTIIQKET